MLQFGHILQQLLPLWAQQQHHRLQDKTISELMKDKGVNPRKKAKLEKPSSAQERNSTDAKAGWWT